MISELSADSAPTLFITNVTVEEGFVEVDASGLRATRTAPATLKIANGLIDEVSLDGAAPGPEAKVIDGGGRLVLPSFYDWHTHLDKTWVTGPWRSCRPWVSRRDRMTEEEALLPAWLPIMAERAMTVLDHQLRLGVTHIRTHANVDPIVGLNAIAATHEAVDAFHDRMQVEIVAFPQHGFLSKNLKSLLGEALTVSDALVGGIDPGGVDRDIERSLADIFDLALTHDVDIDIHLHDEGHLGLLQMERIAELTKAAGWQTRVTISHAYGLADLDDSLVCRVSEVLADAGVAVSTCADLGRTIPIPALLAAGVDVRLGSDGIMQTWSPFGTGNTLERVSLVAERFSWVDERALASALKLGTGGRVTVAESGRVWPASGDEASLVLVSASCSAEAVARRPPCEVVVFRGQQVH